MHKLFCRRTLVHRLSLSLLYLLFFAVQLNLRYNSVEINQSGRASFVAGKYGRVLSSASFSDHADQKVSITNRLNKRYFPGFFHIGQLLSTPSRAVTFVPSNTGIRESFFLLQQHYQLTQRRGPPVDC